MCRRLPTLVFVCLALLPVETVAQSNGILSDEYAVVQTSQDTITAPDGTMTLYGTFTMTQFADDKEGPFANLVGHCWHSVVLETEDTAIAAGGACHLSDPEGNGFWQWFKFDEEGTEECPLRCGTFGDYNGYGIFEGYSSEGTWNLIALFPDGSAMGHHRGTYVWR
jgi:hypothetical protein